MKKFLPFVFPVTAMAIVLFLAVRWYNTKTTHSAEQIANVGDSVQVSALSPADQAALRKQPAKDLKSIQLKGDKGQGEVRYDVKGDKVLLMVQTDLPPLAKGETYTVWVQQASGSAQHLITVLQDEKGGFMGSGEVNIDVLPLDIFVSHRVQNDGSFGTTLLQGVIPAESTR